MMAVYAALLALAGLLGMVPASDAAPLATYYHAGAWDAFSGRNDDGRLVCGIGNTNPADGRKFTLRFTVGEDPILFTVTKPTWTIPNGTQASVVMQVGLERPWTEQATGDGQALSWRLDRTSMQLFDGQFRRASSMTLAFPDGREPAMLVPLTGSTAISEAFKRCISDFSGMGQPMRPPAPVTQDPTQPFSASAATPTGQAAPASNTPAPNTPAPNTPAANTSAPSTPAPSAPVPNIPPPGTPPSGTLAPHS